MDHDTVFEGEGYIKFRPAVQAHHCPSKAFFACCMPHAFVVSRSHLYYLARTMICLLYDMRFKLAEVEILTCYFTQKLFFFSERVKEIFFCLNQFINERYKEISQDA